MKVMDAIIRTIVHEFFIQDPESPGDFNKWVLRDTAYLKAQEMKEKRKENHNLVVAQRKRIEEEAAKRCEQLIEKHAFIRLASKTAGMSIQSPPTGEAPTNLRKRLASEAGMEERTEMYKKRQREWKALVSIQKESFKKQNEYFTKYGDLEAPFNPDLWYEEEDKD